MQYLALLVGMLSVQVGATLAKRLFPILGPEGITVYRLFFGAIIVSAFARPWREKLTRAQFKTILGYGVSLGMMNLLFYLCIARIPLGIAVAIEFAGPLGVAIYYSRKAIDAVWVTLAAIGIALLVPHGAFASELDPIGAALALGAGACWAMYIVVVRHASGTLKGPTATSLGMAAAFLFILPYGAYSAGAKLFRLDVLPLAIGVAIFSSALPYSIDMRALKHITAKTFSIFLSLAPAMAAIVGFLILDERLSLTQWTAIGCVVAASLGSTLSSRRRVK